MKHKNTLQGGSIRFLVFREGQAWYAVGLEFNIVESGTTPQEALLLLMEAASGYLESAKKIKARPHILNQKTDPEYEKKWHLAEESKFKKQDAGSIFTSGRLNLRELQKQALVPA